MKPPSQKQHSDVVEKSAEMPHLASVKIRNNVTVVIPAYNAAKSIESAIESVRTILKCRILVIDDGSTDNTAQISQSLGCETVKQKNAGATHARQNGIQRVQTEFVVLLDSDDQITDGMIEALTLIASSNAVSVVGGRVEILDAKKNVIRTTRALSSSYTTRTLLKQSYSPWPPSAAIWRTSDVLKSYSMGPDLLHTNFAEDFELLIRISTVGRILSVDSTTCRYQAAGGKSATKSLQAVSDSERIRSYYANAYELKHKQLSSRQIIDQARWREYRSTQAEIGEYKATRHGLRSPTMVASIVRYITRISLQKMRHIIRRDA